MLAPLTFLLSLASVAIAYEPYGGHEPVCKETRVRKEWRALTDREKTAYLDAVECLFKKKPALTADHYPSGNRHDDFSVLHINATTALNLNDPDNYYLTGPGVHFNGVFLPFHRYVLWIWENTLRDVCGYAGTQPYWDWSLDTIEHGKNFSDSPLFDAELGFGGNGANGTIPTGISFPPGSAPVGTCINTGRFAKYINPIGWGYNLGYNPHCLKRNFQNKLANMGLTWRQNVLPLLRKTNYKDFVHGVDNDAGNTGATTGIHGLGHVSVGGEMGNVWSSSNDPLFFMHHAQIDRIWALWQSLNPHHVFDMGGPTYPNGTGHTDLNYTVFMIEELAPQVPIYKLMDTKNKNGKGILCYEYQENGQPTS
jgi:tyrosinase